MRRLCDKNILITGASGFIGKHLTNRLLAETNSRLALVSRTLCATDNERAKWINSSLNDLTNETWIINKVKEIDIIFHLAAYTPKTPDEANNIEEIHQNNIAATLALLKSLPSKPERLIFSSTLDVYAIPSTNTIINENSRIGPISLYGSSKLFCESVIKTHAQQNGYRCTILRYGHIFGPGEEAYNKIIPTTIRNLLKGCPPVVYGDGSAERDLLYVEDAIEATLRSATLDNIPPDPINIVSGRSISVLEIVRLLIELTEFHGEIEFIRESSPSHSFRFDNRTMLEILGQWDLVTIREGLKKEVDFFREKMNDH